MNDSKDFVIIGSMVFLTFIAVSVGWLLKKKEVDDVIEEHEVNDIEGPELDKGNIVEELLGKYTLKGHAPPENDIDWDILYKYSDHLGDWVAPFQGLLIISTIPLTLIALCAADLFFSRIGFLTYASPEQRRLYMGVQSTAMTIGLINEGHGLIVHDDATKVAKELVKKNQRNRILGRLEEKIVKGIFKESQGNKQIVEEKYKSIIKHVKDKGINKKSVFNVYLTLYDLKSFHGIEANSILSKKEKALLIEIQKIVGPLAAKG